jgi:PTH1 family peptidyl-tRNA hydrolase
MKSLIVGLGNPGPEYTYTRHNIGFSVVDALAGTSIPFANARYAQVAEVRHKGRTLVLVKPQTYMNLSGKAVRYWMDQENVPAERLLVITDDLALPFGKVRLRASGSGGGHNGLSNIIEVLGHASFPRLRFGIGNDFARGKQVDHVLSEWTGEERTLLPGRIAICVQAVCDFALMGIEHAMNTFNSK